ncbi:hypothetical protein SAMN05421788_106180 [Filimonas lacunae]|uniref:YD repeat-containing protein n=1 Tax=Filimonas lacunae TaxID=477680 RepID=A0A173MF55_9BACT|nr:hypothetical protein [Filimonas lacunae]BAV06119.1 hypothetical protein FLA_2134 [Filimonas lacunae]SIT24738.1 hypothetical protein SAMN05421788_106180 [Filimonas lacunae]
MKNVFLPALLLVMMAIACTKKDSSPTDENGGTGTDTTATPGTNNPGNTDTISKLYRIVNTGEYPYAEIYNYDGTKLLSVFDSSYNGNYLDTAYYTNNVLTRLVTTYNGKVERDYTFEYNNSGKVVKVITNNQERRYDSLAYNQAGQLSTIYMYTSFVDTVYETDEFKWDANNNITQKIRRQGSSMNGVASNYFYDTNTNPRYELSANIVFWLYVRDAYYGSKNNLTNENFTQLQDGVMSTPSFFYLYNYTYNKDKTPTTCVFKSGEIQSDLKLWENLTYQYKTTTK